MYSAERHFVTTAHAQLHLLASDDVTDSVSKQPSFEIAIGKIKQAAGPVKARAVYRAALLCEDVFKRCGSATDMKFRTALARLNSLVGLYADGLFEIDPEFKAVLNGKKPKDTHKIAQNSVPEIPTEQLIAANQNAAAVLLPLLRLVKDDKRTDALTFISGYKQCSKAGQVKPELRTQHLMSVRFDSVMRQVTNHTLGSARAQAKNVSISYAADFENLDPSIASHMQTVLKQACLDIVRTGLVVTGDLVSSINRSWQISITGETRGQDLVMTLSWRGQALPGLREKGRDALQRLGGKINMQPKHQTAPSDEAKLGTHIMAFTCPLRAAEKTLPSQSQVLQTLVRKA